jgi:hypothetical protein
MYGLPLSQEHQDRTGCPLEHLYEEFVTVVWTSRCEADSRFQMNPHHDGHSWLRPFRDSHAGGGARFILCNTDANPVGPKSDEANGNQAPAWATSRHAPRRRDTTQRPRGVLNTVDRARRLRHLRVGTHRPTVFCRIEDVAFEVVGLRQPLNCTVACHGR